MAGKLLCALLFGFFYLVLGKVPHSTQIYRRLRISPLPRNDDPLRISFGCTHISLLWIYSCFPITARSVFHTDVFFRTVHPVFPITRDHIAITAITAICTRPLPHLSQLI